MQKRVRNTVLTEKDNLLFINHELYSGIVFYDTGTGFLTANYVEEGRVRGRYIPFCWPDDLIDHNAILIDDDHLILNGEQATIENGSIFMGIVVSFDKSGYAYAEEFYDEDGMIAADINWNKDMTVKSFRLDHGRGLSESGSYKNEKLEFYSLGPIFFRLNSEGKVEYMSIDQKNIDLTQDKFKVSKFLPIQSIEDIERWGFSKSLVLSGAYIDNNYISKLLSKGKLDQVEKIDFYRTDINDYLILLQLNHIQEIEITTPFYYEKTHEKEKELDLFKVGFIPILNAFKAQQRNVKIIIDGVELK